MATTFSTTKAPTITKGRYGTIEDFGGGGMSYSDPRDNPAFNTPVAPVVPPVVPTAPVDTKNKGTDRSPVLGALDQAKKEAANMKKAQENARREADRYAASMRQMRIDAINTAFQPRIDRQKEENNAQMSRVSALNFNKGIVGSGVDTTKTGEQKGLNKKALEALDDEKAILIQEAFGKADALAKERYELLTKEAQEAAKSNVDYQTSLYDKANEVLTLFGQSGATIDDIERADPNVLKNLREVGGLTDFQIVSMLNKANPSMNAQMEFADGVVYQYYTDPKTGQVKITTTKAEGVPENYKPTFAPDGTLLFLPDKFDPSKPYNEQVIAGGNFAKPETAGSGGKFNYTDLDKNEDERALDEARGEDGYTDPTIYQTLYKNWIDAGGNLKDFLFEFPPQNYVNPENDWLPYYLRPKNANEREA